MHDNSNTKAKSREMKVYYYKFSHYITSGILFEGRIWIKLYPANPQVNTSKIDVQLTNQ